MRKSMSNVVRLLLLFAVSVLGFSQSPVPPASSNPAQATQNADLSDPSTVLKVKTRLVVVDVVAQTGKGQPVTDLKAEDFTLTEDDKPQQIRSFSLQQSSAGSSAARPQIPPLPANMVTNLPQYQTSGPWNVLLLDALNTNLSNQAYMREQMIKFLEKLPSGAPIAVYLLGSKLRLVQDFTSDPDTLKQAIRSLKLQGSVVLSNPSGMTPETDLPPGSIANALLASVPGLRGQILAFQEEHTAAQTDFQVRYTLRALNSLGRTLAGYPGRKNLIWISEAFPFDILSVRNHNNRDYSNDVAATGSMLSDAQVAIYPVDARGLVNYSAYSAGSDPNPLAGGAVANTTLNGAMGQEMNAEANVLMAAHTSMSDLADKTGGKAFWGHNNLDGEVQQSLTDGSTYYTLAYYPDNKDWNGDFRKIHLKVNRAGLKLRYRLGYFADDRTAFTKETQAQQDEAFNLALSLDWPIATALRFTAQVLPPSAQTQNKVVVRYRIDPRGLNFEQGSDGFQHVAVLCAVRAYSIKNSDKIVAAEANNLSGPLRPEAYSRVVNAGFLPCQEQIELLAGDYFLRVGVRDNSTGLIGTATARVTVPATTAATGKP
ncbi:MAG TPA: VWA domain-containing protein [Candidatus Angelobacter sp.]